MADHPVFEMRAVYECGWNLFHRNGFSTRPEEISVNYRYLDHLHEAGINWLVVFWANGRSFDAAWREVVPYAHKLGIKVARGMYGFSGGGPEYHMAEPDVPAHLLKPSPQGPNTALCPFDEAAREWIFGQLPKRTEPDIDGIFLEPARVISRNCLCEQCRSLPAYEWDVMVLNMIAEALWNINPNVEFVPYVYMPGGKEDKRAMAEAYSRLDPRIRHIFSWGSDDEEALIDWLEADSRFEHYCKLGRTILFPYGDRSGRPAVERARTVLRWCRIAADKGKKGYMFDYRVFGGREWDGKWDSEPVTRVSDAIPASLALIGKAMNNPYMPDSEFSVWLEELRSKSDWDLDDAKYFYFGDKPVRRDNENTQ